MKFTCNREILLKEISIAQDIISSKNAISIYSNVYLETGDNILIIKATDRNVNFETEIPVTVIEQGSTTVFGDKFFGFLSTLSNDEIEFTQKGNTAVIKPTMSNKPKCELKIIASEKYPEFSPSSAPFFDMPIKDFREMIQQSVFAVSDDETRYFMNGVFFEKSEGKLIMVATDGRRLAYIGKPFSDNEVNNIQDFTGIIIPPKILNTIVKRSGDEGIVSISVDTRHIFINFASYKFSSVLIEGSFPNYKKVIPENQDFYLSVKREELLSALRNVLLMVEKKSHRIYLGISPGKMEINSEESENGVIEDEIPCKYDGEDITIAFNYRYLEEPFKIMTNIDEIKIHFSNASKAVTIEPVPPKDFFHIVMPIRS
jgi:DNA polymerase-3 subunit beta